MKVEQKPVKQKDVFTRYPAVRLDTAPDTFIETYVASTWYRRFRGLLGKRPLEEHEGLLLLPCRSIHTFGMRYAIDVVFLGAQSRILAIERHIRRGRVLRCRRAYATLELLSGSARHYGLQPGQHLLQEQSSSGQSLTTQKSNRNPTGRHPV
ncbi:MAG: DUF192 domain-containing protein [Oleiphilaceae bacterium]|nr:DUF192 domain-containing protein [Oleiphilaceae bacterium]